MAQEGVKLKKLQGGLGGQNASTDSHSCLIIGADVSGIAAEQDTIYELYRASDADALGFTASYDANNQTLVRHHIEEFFRLAPNARLFVVPVAVGQSQDVMLSGVKNLLKANGTIKLIGIANGVYTVNATENLVQAEVNSLASEYMLIDSVILEGTGDQFLDGSGSPLTVAGHFDLKTLNAPTVTVCIAQQGITDELMGNPAVNHNADVGAALGMLAVRNVSEHIGSVQIENEEMIARELIDGEGSFLYSLSDVLNTRWQDVRLSNGQRIIELGDASKYLAAKGYLFADYYPGHDGFYFVDDATCIANTSDYSQIRLNRIWNKCARTIRVKLFPRVKSKIKKDAATGLMTATTVGSLEKIASSQLDKILTAGDIGGYQVTIDPNQLVGVDSPLAVTVQITVDDIVHQFEVGIGFANSLS